MKFWEKNLWIEPVNIPLEQPKQAYSDLSFFSGAEDGSQIEPILDVTRLNYTTFFPNPEEAQLLALQLKQLRDYLELKKFT